MISDGAIDASGAAVDAAAAADEATSPPVVETIVLDADTAGAGWVKAVLAADAASWGTDTSAMESIKQVRFARSRKPYNTGA